MYKVFTAFLNIRFYIAFTILLLSSCSTSKDTFLHRQYHQITTRFNGYFNGNVSFSSGLEQLYESHIDNYSQLLPIYIIGDEKSAQSIYSYMDNAIKKGSIVIKKHSMNIRNNQKNKWIDDNYLLIGKARFYKREYIEAIDAFNQVQKMSENEKIFYDATYWTARCYVELENYIQATNYIELIEIDPNLPSHLRDDVHAVLADIFIRQKEYENAIESLKNAIAKAKNKDIRARYTFVLAQVYQLNSDLENATRYYEEVVKINPDYEMVFNALMKQASCFVGGNNKAIINALKDMLKDDKNVDYLDQIYYAMAEVFLKGENKERGIKFLNRSISESTINNHQKALSYLKLATIYFDERKYITSQAYYDSTVTFISPSHTDYENILNKKNSLTDLVNHLNTIHNQDSLLQLAALDSSQINRVIRGVIQDLKRKEKELMQGSQGYYQSKADAQRNNQTANRMNAGNGNWYFYNPTTVSFGFNEFRKIWGNRKLEDNWRRKNKEINAFFSEVDSLNEDGSIRETDIYTAEYYLQDIPFKKEDKEKSINKIIEAYYQLSLVYKEKLNDYEEASKTLEKLLQEHPQNKYELQCYYNLYRNYTQIKNKGKAKKFQDILLEKYPYSDFAKLISDPNYLKKKERNESQVMDLYTETYTLFLNNENNNVISNCNNVIDSHPEDSLIPKFYLLKAMAIGKNGDKEKYISALNDVVVNCTGKDEAQEAQDIISVLLGNIKEASSIYNFTADEEHYYVILFPNTGVNSNDFKSAFSDFNIKYFSLENLIVKSLFLNREYQIITIRGLANSNKAIQYYNTIRNSEEVLRHLSGNSYDHFVISLNNFTMYYANKNTESYIDFFKTNYLTKN